MRFLIEVIIFETLLVSLRCISSLSDNFICDFVNYSYVLMTVDLSAYNYLIFSTYNIKVTFKKLLWFKVS
jgi:hypothetical protein